MYLLDSPRMFPEELHGKINEKIKRSADFCADQIDVITNFAVITNVVIRRAHCTTILVLLGCFTCYLLLCLLVIQ